MGCSPHKALRGSCDTLGRCSGNHPWETTLCPVGISQPRPRERGAFIMQGTKCHDGAAMAVGESAPCQRRADRGIQVLDGPSAFGFAPAPGGATTPARPRSLPEVTGLQSLRIA